MITRLLARWPRLLVAAHRIPRVRLHLERHARREHAEVAAAEREARGIRIPQLGDNRCVWCGATRIATTNGDVEWVLDMATPACVGHEVLADAEARIDLASYALSGPARCPNRSDGIHEAGCGCYPNADARMLDRHSFYDGETTLSTPLFWRATDLPEPSCACRCHVPGTFGHRWIPGLFGHHWLGGPCCVTPGIWRAA